MTGIRLKSIIKIPADIQGGDGVTVVNEGGTVTISVDPDTMPAGLNWQGNWNSLTAYVVNDAVAHEGASYIATVANLNSEPPSADWDLLAQAGSGTIVVDDQITPPMLDADTAPLQLAFRDRLNFVSREGDTLTGHLVLPIDPASSNAVRKDYVTAYAAPLDALAYNGMQINGSIDVNQEGIASKTVTGYVCDGWYLAVAGTMAVSAGQFGGVTTNPGFPNILGITITTPQVSLVGTDVVSVGQRIEGYRIVRLGWGTPAAQPASISFWTAHNRPGLYSVGVRNGTGSRSYATTYTQNVANVYEFKTVTIPGDTTGTWNAVNQIGMLIDFPMACGPTYTAPSVNTWMAGNFFAAPGQVNGVGLGSDVFRLTGVVVLPGTQAPTAAQSPLIMRPYDQELVTCQRYYYKRSAIIIGYSTAAAADGQYFAHPVFMRVAPTVTPTGGSFINATGLVADNISPEGHRMYTGLNFTGTYSVTDFTITGDARL